MRPMTPKAAPPRMEVNDEAVPFDSADARQNGLEPSAPPPPWIERGQQGCDVDKLVVIPRRCILFTPLAAIACTVLMVIELQENARGVDFQQPLTDACEFRFAIRDTPFCAAAFKVNPMFGPSSEVLLRMGAISGDVIVKNGEAWRLFSGMWLHGGVLHCLMNVVALLGIGCQLERAHGTLRVGAIYMLSGIFGSIASAMFAPHVLSVGASGAIFGLIGAIVGDILMNWDLREKPCRALLWVCFVSAVQLLVGTMPLIDNFAHFFGFVMGFVSSITFLDRLNKGARCWHTCSRRCFRTLAAAIVFFAFVVGLALLYGIGGVDANELCQACQEISCKEFPWGCTDNGGHCWWTCDQMQNAPAASCGAEAVWPRGANTTQGYVDLTCPPRAGGNASKVRVEPVDLTHWGTDFLGELCKDHCASR